MSADPIPSPSPRPSFSLRSPPSSRTSLDGQANASAPRATGPRRNRVALRDYYGIKSALGDAAGSEHGDSEQTALNGTSQPQSALSDLDREGFEAGGYVKGLLERESLENILKVEGTLVEEIRGLDGDRKALVYDNYSKLIAATDTIKTMRASMDPLTPATSTLAPAVSHIAETATSLSKALAVHPVAKQPTMLDGKEKQRETVRWVLNTPQRLSRLLDEDRREDAERDWAEIKPLLERWQGVGGVEELWDRCEQALAETGSSPSDDT